MGEISWYKGQRQVNLSVNDFDVQPKVFQGTHKVSSGWMAEWSELESSVCFGNAKILTKPVTARLNVISIHE